MRYYVTSDVHGFYTPLRAALTEIGYFEDKEPHKLIICGDLFDRGGEALELQSFLLDLLEKDELIIIRGNHDDLAIDLLKDWNRGSYLDYRYHANGSVGTAMQLTGATLTELFNDGEEIGKRFANSPYIQTIMPAMVDYYETDNYIFTHGWIPCSFVVLGDKRYIPMKDWRKASLRQWEDARWMNGMDAAHQGIIEPGKTIVCGHVHVSYGHRKYENDGGELDNNPNFTPYYSDGIIALDACTAFSGKVNCIVIED